MKLYVIRHGQTTWKVNRKIQGKQDTELKEVGIRQAYEAKDCETEEGDIYNYYKNESKMKIEPVVELCNRINKLLEEIKNNYKSNTILLVTHSGTARAIEAYFYGIDKDGELPPENLRNCEIREYEF